MIGGQNKACALIPKIGTLERIFLEKVAELGSVTYMDFEGTGITRRAIVMAAAELGRKK